MKRIFFLRHGKSDWGDSRTIDHQRPLAPRGIRAARRVGQFLVALDQFPAHILTSTAVRARTTAELAAQAQTNGSEFPSTTIVATDRLYEASFGDVVDLICQQDDEISSLLIAGHEPTSSTSISILTGGSTVKFPTAALARLDFPAESWSSLGPGRCRLAWLVTPKLLRAISKPIDKI